MAIQASDSRPWFKHFWPWFLILLPASVVVAATATLIIANRGADDLVAQEYYKDGLAINRRLEKEQRAITLGISASPTFAENTATVTIQAPHSPASLQLEMSHPMEADRDFAVTLNKIADNTYSGNLPYPVENNWHWKIEPPDPESWQLNGTVGQGGH